MKMHIIIYSFLILLSGVSTQAQVVQSRRNLLNGKQLIQIGSSQCSVESSSNARGDDEKDFVMIASVQSFSDCCQILSNNPNYNVFVYCPRPNNCFNQLNPNEEIPFKACYLKYQETVAQGNQPNVYTEAAGVDFISGHIPFKSRGQVDCSDGSAIECDLQVLQLIKSRLSAEGQQFYSSWTGTNPCDGSWRDIVCDNADGQFRRVTQLNFGSTFWFLNSDGLWSRDFSRKTQFDSTRFDQPLPVEITKMQWLQLFATSGINGFTGKIIPEFSSLKRLAVLDIKENILTGTIPPEISVLGYLDLAALDISTNRITGFLPVELSTCSKLQLFRTSRNTNMISNLPPQYSTWKEMRFFETWESGLIGTIPVEYSEFQKITAFQLNGNNIAGTLPDQFSLWNKINIFHVPANNLFGTLPSAYSVFAPADLLLSSNAFTGVLPTEYSSFSRLEAGNQAGNLCVEDPSIFQGDVGLPTCF